MSNLTLTRKVGERIDFYHPATGIFSVSVERIRGNRVALTSDAPGEVRIMRGELTDRAGGILGDGTDSPPGNEAPPASAAPASYICQAVGYPLADRCVQAESCREAAEEYVRLHRPSDPTPIDVRVQRHNLFDPIETFRVSWPVGCEPAAELIGVVMKPSGEPVKRATAQEVFEAGVFEREGA